MRQGYKFIRESGCKHDDDYLGHLFNDIFCWTNGTYKLCYTRPDMEAVNGDNILDIENGENKILSFDYHMQLLVSKRNNTWKIQKRIRLEISKKTIERCGRL